MQQLSASQVDQVSGAGLVADVINGVVGHPIHGLGELAGTGAAYVTRALVGEAGKLASDAVAFGQGVLTELFHFGEGFFHPHSSNNG